MSDLSLRMPLKAAPVAAAVAAALLLSGPGADARVTRIVIDSTSAVANQPGYEQLTGRAFGTLDPNDPHNAIITDIKLVQGTPQYVASFVIRKPKDMTVASGVMWHDVPNRGGDVGFNVDSFAANDVQLLSGWQGDNAGGTSVPANATCVPPYVAPCAAPAFPHHYVVTPVLKGVTGRILGRIVNRNGNVAAPLNVMGNPIPYFPNDLANHTGDVLTVHTHETLPGVVTEAAPVDGADWKYCAAGGSFATPGNITSLPVNVCTRNGFDGTKLYELHYTVKDPYVLGAGTAAFRDVQSFFRYEATDDAGNANPLAGKIKTAIIRGVSQSGNFTRHFIFLGMNEDEKGRIVHDGAWPIIAGRRVSNNSRWGQPDGVLELYQMGSEGPQWWHTFPDQVRDLHPGGILDRCARTDTCPKIVETFGGSEVFALKMTTEWVGTDPKTDIPLPDNVRRYYLPGSTHGGSNRPDSGFNELITGTANCPGNNWGTGTLPVSAIPSLELTNRIRVALRDWVTKGIEPPESVWPRMRGPKNQRALVESTALGFPSGVPGIPASIFSPDNFVNPVLDYDWGPEFDEFNATGVPTNIPPPIKHVIKMMIPAVDSDGNELGGVPTTLRDAPLATYLGWNITSAGFHAGQVCNYVGGMVPFAITKAKRIANNDPRPSLEERYGSHDGYVAAVRKAADNAACQGYLFAGGGKDSTGVGPKCSTVLQPGVNDDWQTLMNRAIASNVCNLKPADNGKCVEP